MALLCGLYTAACWSRWERLPLLLLGRHLVLPLVPPLPVVERKVTETYHMLSGMCICEYESVNSLIPHFFKNEINYHASALTNLRQLLFNIKAATRVNDKNYKASGVSLGEAATSYLMLNAESTRLACR